MNDFKKTKTELIEELIALRAEVTALKRAAQSTPVLSEPSTQQTQWMAGFFHAATQANIGWFLLDTDFRYLQINQILADFNGYPVEHHIGQRLPDLLPDLAPSIISCVEAVIKTRQPVLNVEVSGSTPKQSEVVRHWLASYFPVTHSRDEVVAVGGIVLEVTADKQMIAALRQSEKDLQTAQRLAHVGSWDWDCVTQTGRWSEETYRIHGCDPAQPPPQGADLERYIHPDDLPLYQQLVERANAGYSFEVDLRIIRPDGEVRYIEARGEPGIFNEQGELLRLFGTVLDVTERKRVEAALRKSEFALREAQRLAHVGSWSCTPETGIVWSEEIYRIHGLEPNIGTPTGADLMRYTHPEDYAIHQAIIEAVSNGQPYDMTSVWFVPAGKFAM